MSKNAAQRRPKYHEDLFSEVSFLWNSFRESLGEFGQILRVPQNLLAPTPILCAAPPQI